MSDILTIKVGQILSARSVGDSECIFTCEVVGRTEKMVMVSQYEREVRCKVYVYEGKEYIMPMGKYAGAPRFYAEVTEEEKEEQALEEKTAAKWDTCADGFFPTLDYPSFHFVNEAGLVEHWFAARVTDKTTVVWPHTPGATDEQKAADYAKRNVFVSYFPKHWRRDVDFRKGGQSAFGYYLNN